MARRPVQALLVLAPLGSTSYGARLSDFLVLALLFLAFVRLVRVHDVAGRRPARGVLGEAA